MRLGALAACVIVVVAGAPRDAWGDDGGIDAGGLPEAGSFPEAGVLDAGALPDAASFPDAGGGQNLPDAAAFPDAASVPDGGGGAGGGGQQGSIPVADSGTPDALLAKPCADPTEPLKCLIADPIVFDKTVKLPIAFDWDTGWIPGGSPLQVRFYVKLPAFTHVKMQGAFQTTWPSPLTLYPQPGRFGIVNFDYGLEIGAKAKLAVKILGQNIGWEGDIPYVPQVNFHVIGSKTFEPWGWAPGATASGFTAPLTLFQLPITDLIIPIPGISGGIELNVQGELAVSYTTEKISIKPNAKTPSQGPTPPVTKPDASTVHPWIDGAYAEYLVHPEGAVKYVGTIHLFPAIYVEVLNKKFSIPVGIDFPVSLTLDEQKWVFDDQLVHVPVPNIQPPALPGIVDFGQVPVGDQKTISVKLPNIGEARARMVGTLPAGTAFKLLDSSAEFDLGASGEIKVRYQPKTQGMTTTTLKLDTNDPDRPVIEVPLVGEGVGGDLPSYQPDDAGAGGTGSVGAGGSSGAGTVPGGAGGPASAPTADDEMGQAGSCGCRVSPRLGVHGLWLAVAPLAFALRRRRSRPSPRPRTRSTETP
ncbi:MAG: hypothetical protein IT374_25995 [Polyangiaceae bacterium]|nr:hypothetical protein [Polyangiaceae bacterium]